MGARKRRITNGTNDQLQIFPVISSRWATFEVKGTKFRRGKSKAEEYYLLEQVEDSKVALSEFQPEKRLTLNKQTYLVEGIGVSHSKNPVNQMESSEFS